MEGYLFVGSNSDGENADALIDAETVEQAKALYHQWCEDVLGEPTDAAQVWLLPNLSQESRALQWSADIVSVHWTDSRSGR